MATDWAADVKKYAPNADDAVIAGIVRYCGIALQKVDSSLVAFSDKKETDRVRESFLKKKLGLTQNDKTLDAAIAKVGETMKADRTKNRVTVYYLLADQFKKLGLFAPKAKAAAKAPAKKPAAKANGAAALAGAAGLAAAATAAKAPAKKAAAPAKKADAPAKKAAAPAKKAAAPAAVATTKKKPPTKKVAIKAPAAPQGLLDKAAGAGTAAVAGTVAAAGAVAATAASAATSAASAAKDTAAKAVDVAGDAAGAVTGAAGAAVTGAAGLAASAGAAVSGAVSQLAGTDDEDSGLGWLWWVIGLALLLFAAWYFFLRNPGDAAAPAVATTEAAAPAAAADLTAAPAEGTVEIPTGAGVTSELRDGKPVVKVYFDTGKTDLAPAFTGAAGGLKAWLEANAGSSLAISGYSDPSGNAAANAELAKNRAQAVQAALVAAGIPEASALLVKPEESADATVPAEAARRVEVLVK